MKLLYSLILSAFLIAGAAQVSAATVADAPQIEAAGAQPTVTPRLDGVEIANPSEHNALVAIYAITGQLVKHFRVVPGTTFVDLAPGCYIVRVDGYARRIAIS